MHHFLTTGFDSDKGIRVKPLPGQHLLLEDGTIHDVDDTLNTQCDKNQRSAYRVRTVFGTDCLKAVTNKEGKITHYSAAKIYPVTNERGGEGTPPAMKEAYQQYLDPASAPAPTGPTPVSMPPREKKTYLAALRDEPNLKPPTAEEGFWVDPDVWYYLLRNIRNNINTIIIGPTGAGKTQLVAKACEEARLNLSMYKHEMGAMADAVGSLIGVHRIEEGRSFFDFAPFTRDIQKEGVLLLDEISRAPAMTNNILFPVLDDSRYLQTALAGQHAGEGFAVNPECSFVATANIGAEYTGTRSLDRALSDRFLPIEVDYMPPAIEAKVLKTRCTIGIGDAMLIAKVAENLRNQYKKQDLTTAVSTRYTLAAGDLVRDGFTVAVAMKLTFLPLFDGTTSEGERSIVSSVIASR